MSLTTEPPNPARPPIFSHPDTSPHSQLGAAFPKTLVRTLLETVRVPDKESPAQQNERLDAAVTALMAIDAQTPVDMMFAAHAVASHHATMECFRRAMLATGNPDIATRMHKSAVTLSRMMADNLRTLGDKPGNAADRLAGGIPGGRPHEP